MFSDEDKNKYCNSKFSTPMSTRDSDTVWTTNADVDKTSTSFGNRNSDETTITSLQERSIQISLSFWK